MYYIIDGVGFENYYYLNDKTLIDAVDTARQWFEALSEEDKDLRLECKLVSAKTIQDVMDGDYEVILDLLTERTLGRYEIFVDFYEADRLVYGDCFVNRTNESFLNDFDILPSSAVMPGCMEVYHLYDPAIKKEIDTFWIEFDGAWYHTGHNKPALIMV